jgi:hypothetical protein
MQNCRAYVAFVFSHFPAVSPRTFSLSLNSTTNLIAVTRNLALLFRIMSDGQGDIHERIIQILGSPHKEHYIDDRIEIAKQPKLLATTFPILILIRPLSQSA